MLIKKPADIRPSEITPKSVYLNRRKLLAGGAALGAATLAGLHLADPGEAAHAAAKLANIQKSSFSTDEKQTPYDVVTKYNNFYEFGTAKEQPAELAKNWKPNPEWPVTVEGLAGKPRTFSLDQIMRLAPLEERIYRMRCVEGWSIVVPWVGLPLNALLKQVDPLGKAKYVAFESYYNPKQMPQGNYAGIPFPYVEGLRLDEAMHPLTLLAVGLYGETLPNQNGTPIRLVVPWKYGFKGIKSIVKIKLTDKSTLR